MNERWRPSESSLASGFSPGEGRWQIILHDAVRRIQRRHLAFQESGEVPYLLIIHPAESGFDFGDGASIKVPPGKLGLSGKSFLCPAYAQAKTGKISANTILLCLLQYRSLTMLCLKAKTGSDIGASSRILHMHQPMEIRCLPNQTRRGNPGHVRLLNLTFTILIP